ncbi:MAG: hypothetical protein R3C68_02015 [Myxococcota bacterium]
MKHRTFWLITALALGGAGVLSWQPTPAQAGESAVVEQWVNPNHLRLHINGRWEDVPLVPLADHLCKSGHRMFRKYCQESSISPENR